MTDLLVEYKLIIFSGFIYSFLKVLRNLNRIQPRPIGIEDSFFLVDSDGALKIVECMKSEKMINKSIHVTKIYTDRDHCQGLNEIS